MISIPGSRLKNDLFRRCRLQWVLFLTLRRLRPFRRLIFLVLLVAAGDVHHSARSPCSRVPLLPMLPCPFFFHPCFSVPAVSFPGEPCCCWLSWSAGSKERAGRSLSGTEHLRRIYQLTHAVARSETIEMVYEEALNALERSVKADRASVLVFDASGLMRFKAWRGLSENIARPSRGIPLASRRQKS